MYELCVAAMPFQEMRDIHVCELADYITQGGRPTIPDYVPNVFARLIRRCWQSDPRDRPTFRCIVTEMGRGEFLFDGTDEAEYFDYLFSMLETINVMTSP
jgi:hypothetical protein